MDNTDAKERDLIDLEGGGTASQEEGSRDGATGVGRTKAFLDMVWSGFTSFDGLPRSEDSKNPCENSLDSPDAHVEQVELCPDGLGEAGVGFVEKNAGTPTKEKPKKKSSKKPPKPPRPPTALLLDAADQKLVREISELAMLKKARAERLKTLKKMRDVKTTSSSNTMCAMAVTVIFCLVIILHGVFSRSNSNAQFEGSPEYALASGEGFISVQYNRNLPASGTADLGSGSPNIVEPVLRSRTKEN